MALQESIVCGNCGRSGAESGGRFTFKGNKWVCAVACDPGFKGTRDHAKNNFSFESMNISADPNQGPVKVNNLAHLRRLEREHGVVSVVGNMDEKNWG